MYLSEKSMFAVPHPTIANSGFQVLSKDRVYNNKSYEDILACESKKNSFRL